MKTLAAIALGLVASVILVRHHRGGGARLVAEDASAPLKRIAIHYAPNADRVALGDVEAAVRGAARSVEVEVEVGRPTTSIACSREVSRAAPNLARLHPVVVGATNHDLVARSLRGARQRTRSSRRRASKPPIARAGDALSPGAISLALYGREPRVADFAFEGGDLAATPRFVFADIEPRRAQLRPRRRRRSRDDPARAASPVWLKS